MTKINRVYKNKIILYGNQFQVYDYGRVRLSFKNLRKDFSRSFQGLKRSDSITRTRDNIYKTITCNLDYDWGYKPIFTTLTYKDNQTDVSLAYKHFKQFISNLADTIGYRPQYFNVLEFQKRGAVHFHVIFFNVPFLLDSLDILKTKPWLDKYTEYRVTFETLWGRGKVTTRSLSRVRNIASYVSKYLTKQTLSSRLFGVPVVSSSRGLLRPITSYDPLYIDSYLEKNKPNATLLQKYEDSDKMVVLTYKKNNN